MLNFLVQGDRKLRTEPRHNTFLITLIGGLTYGFVIAYPVFFENWLNRYIDWLRCVMKDDMREISERV